MYIVLWLTSVHQTSNADSEELTKKISSLSSKFPDPDKAREDLHKLSTAKDNSIFKQLSILGDVDAKYSAIKTAKVATLACNFLD